MADDVGGPAPAPDTPPTAAPSGRPPTPPPPTSGRPVELLDGPVPPPDAQYLVTYEDEEYAFEDRSWGRFGRDDARCQIPVWEELNGSSLSRVTGEIWCLDGELWVRNLSTNHELTVVGSVGRPQTLPPRHVDERGWACSVPGRSAEITAASTGTWRINTRRLGRPAEPPVRLDSGPVPVGDEEPRTARMAALPSSLLPVATELCAPMLEQGNPPATYDEIAVRLNVSRRQARRYVDKLCEYYGDSVFASADAGAAGRPHYVPVAELLVGRGRITREDVRRERRRRGDDEES